MGTWYLEIVKMAIYIFIPVGAFYGYHQVGEVMLVYWAQSAGLRHAPLAGQLFR